MAQPRLVCGVFTHTAVLHPAHGRRVVAKSKQYEHHCEQSADRPAGDCGRCGAHLRVLLRVYGGLHVSRFRRLGLTARQWWPVTTTLRNERRCCLRKDVSYLDLSLPHCRWVSMRWGAGGGHTHNGPPIPCLSACALHSVESTRTLGPERMRSESCWDHRSTPGCRRIEVSFASEALDNVPSLARGGVWVEFEDVESQSRCDSTIGWRPIGASQSRDNRLSNNNNPLTLWPLKANGSRYLGGVRRSPSVTPRGGRRPTQSLRNPIVDLPLLPPLPLTPGKPIQRS